ncbi:rhomboid family intramembrane serine protease [Asticcacaulis sp. BYS171W]|uniref:Rhomboid family intramembrane serine protease n=1 Tax=Asticcacaulis aquaticus TaxID=2984212 RepID=A0ABT5HYV7_9CAUL|nr:rhomboid family intramembrane serine protease [Asticcacaulis aquaticus]MDC7685243.1 rhomboid family intramembrane serine protease [Asticcacaulis aquaticus]
MRFTLMRADYVVMEMKNEPYKEPLFTAPWPAVVLSGLILALYALQSHFDTRGMIQYAFGLNPTLLFSQGAYDTLVTTMFLHGSWTHAGFNALFGLAFASGVARVFGTHFRGAVLFYIYYLLCGGLAGLIYCLVFPDRNVLLIGASGAISGLMGAAIRLGPGYILPVTDKRVVGMSLAWLIINALSAFVSLVPGEGPIAWEVHLIGYALGLLSIGVWMRLFRPRFFRTPVN